MSEDNPTSGTKTGRVPSIGHVEYGKAGEGKVMHHPEPHKPLVFSDDPAHRKDQEEILDEAALYMNGYQQMAAGTNFVEDNIEKWFATAADLLCNAGHDDVTDSLDRAKTMMLLSHHALGLAGEAGEVAGKVKKLIRDKQGYMTLGDIEDITKEMGDVLWYMAALCDTLGVNLSDVAGGNLTKLYSRKERGALSGSGDNR